MQMILVLPIPSSISGISNVFSDDSPMVLLPISVAPYVYGRVAS